jgi:pyrimidine oxygenase
MQIGVFIPTGNNGWFISRTSPQFAPSFALNKHVLEEAEKYGFEFALAMVKLHGFGGATRFWDDNLESITLMAGLASVTKTIQLYATVAVLTVPPAIAARMAVTIADISNDRFGFNIVGGWQKAEYDQMGLWPGEAHFARRYEYCGEYVTVMRELLETGQSNFKGEFFEMQDCKLGPLPRKPIPIVCAGQSRSGIEFSVEHGDYSFVAAKGTNTPIAHADTLAMVRKAAADAGRDIGVYLLVLIIVDETDEAAFERWNCYREGADIEALEWVASQAGENKNIEKNSVVATLTESEGAISLNIGRLIGSYANVARMLDEMAELDGTSGIMLILEEYQTGLGIFGEKVQPLMKSRMTSKLKEDA